jgi:hypothetical protein
MISTLAVCRTGDGIPHDGTVIDAEIGQPAGEDRHAGRRPAGERSDGTRDLFGGEDGRHVDANAALRERLDRLEQGLSAGVGHRQLDVDVAAPRRDLVRLGDHLRQVVGKHLE